LLKEKFEDLRVPHTQRVDFFPISSIDLNL